MDEKIKILCVDDEPNVLNALKRLFLDEDYTILIAPSGQDGLKILEQEHVQLVISDYRMPVMNGVEFLSKVRNKWPDTVRIVLSGYADAASIVAAINEGQIYKFIPKPWNDDELKITISTAIERYFLFKKNLELAEELQKKNNELTRLNNILEEHLEFRAKALDIQQRILDALPVGVMGIDFNNIIVMLNSKWIKLGNSAKYAIGANIFEVMPENIINFIKETKAKHSASTQIELGGVSGRLMCSLLESEEQEGIILVFVPGDTGS